MSIRLYLSDRPPVVVDEDRASAILSTAAVMRGWFYARDVRAKVGELLYLALEMLERSPIDVKREWSKIFCFKWSDNDEETEDHVQDSQG